MASVLVTMKVMPQSPEVNLDWVFGKLKPIIENVGLVLKNEKQPIAFGLQALMITMQVDESKGDTEQLEKCIASVQGVGSVEVVDVRRAIG